MGGSILFTETTTFDPKVYGLVPGKFINYIIIGGGGAGGSCGEYRYKNKESDSWDYKEGAFNVGGSNGQASSIGNYITVNGGANGSGFLAPKWYDSDGDTRYYDHVDGGRGASGWIPGKIFNLYSKGGYPQGAEKTTTNSFSNRFQEYIDGDYKIIVDTYFDNNAITSYPASSASNTTNPSISAQETGHQMTGTPNPYKKNQIWGTLSQGNDGIGYGAGGGGHEEYDDDDNDAHGGQGGNSGEFKMGSFKLDSTNIISITVGEGGSPHTGISSVASQNYPYLENRSSSLGMTGTSGAVMLFWD